MYVHVISHKTLIQSARNPAVGLNGKQRKDAKFFSRHAPLILIAPPGNYRLGPYSKNSRKSTPI